MPNFRVILMWWRGWWHTHHPRLRTMDMTTGMTPGHGAPRCPVCDGFVGKCDHA